jgi:signal transduction histidine kinase
VTRLAGALAALALAALVASAGAAALALESDHLPHKGASIAIGLFVTWSFVGTGLYAWWRRPGSRFGALMTATGLAFLLSALVTANDSVAFTAGVLLSNVYFVTFVHMLLVYPDGRLERRWHGRLLAVAYVLVIVCGLPQLLFGLDPSLGCENCPPSALLVERDATLRDVLTGVAAGLGVILTLVILAVLLERWREASPPQRRALAPLLWSGAAMLVLVATALGSDAAGVGRLTDVTGTLGLVAFASVPWAFLIGLVRSRVAGAGAVSELLRRLGEAPGAGDLRARLADALGDRGLELAFWLDEHDRWVDAEGRPVTLPRDDDPARAWTAVEHEGRPVGAIVHDRTLCEEPGLLRSVAAAAGLAMANERLQAQLHARVQELRASRARIVEAGTHERRRLERNLHDGAQQRLVALSLTLRLAQARLRTEPDVADALLGGAQDELNLALGELRELARGIHPAILSDRGLGAALEALAGRAPIPVELAELPPEPLPEPIEAAAYFLVAEALTNVVKYARASQATVRVARHNGAAVVEVADDGVGGADPRHGSGLRGLADRVSALDGRIEIESPAGAGTRLRAEIPV